MKRSSQAGRIAQNPLAVIASLIALVEVAFSYPVTKLSGSNQTIVVWFMVGFPTLLLLCFFATVWIKPGHLYGPKDYGGGESFLRGIGRLPAVSVRKGVVLAGREVELDLGVAEDVPARSAPGERRKERDVIESRDMDVARDYPRAR